MLSCELVLSQLHITDIISDKIDPNISRYQPVDIFGLRRYICKYAKPNQSEISPRLPYHVTYCFLNSHLAPDSRIWSPQTSAANPPKDEHQKSLRNLCRQNISRTSAMGGVCCDVFLLFYLQLITAHL